MEGIIRWQRVNQQVFVENQNNVSFNDFKISDNTCLFVFKIELSDKYTDENFVLKMLSANELSQQIEQNTLLATMRHIQDQYPMKSITILVCGLKEFCRKSKNVGRVAFETKLTELQILLNVNHRLIETSADLDITVLQFSKSIGDIPFKLV